MAARSKSKRRAPLMESDTEVALRRRGAELIGLLLLGIAALACAMIWTYSPDDPSLFSATDEAPRNALGLVGASLADPLHRALGWAAYGIAAGFAVWGLRLILHAGEAPRSSAAPSPRRWRSSSPPPSPPPTCRPPAGPTPTASAACSATPPSATLLSILPLDVTPRAPHRHRRPRPRPSSPAPATPSASPGPSSAASCASSARARSCSTPAPTA